MKTRSVLLVFLIASSLVYPVSHFFLLLNVYATTGDTENFVDNNTSNVDGHTGHGTSSNFTAQQDANVAFNDTLTEADTGVATWVSPNGYVDPSSVWSTETYAYDDDTATRASRSQASKTWTGYLWLNTTIIAKCSAIEWFVGMSTFGAFTLMEVALQNSTSTYLIYNSTMLTVDDWDTTSFTTVTNVVAMRMRFYNNHALTKIIYVYEMDFQSDAVSNYEMDYEFQWTTADYDETNEYLCIRTYTYTNTEVLKVDVRSGSNWVTVIASLTASAWNNVSISTYLTSATITFRFLGATETGDTSQSTWKIECSLIHVWSEGESTPPTYSGISSNATIANTPCNFSVTLADETALANYTFGTNNTGTWANDTVVTISGLSYKANTTKTLNSTVGIVVQWKYWFADSSNNLNNTGILSNTTTAYLQNNYGSIAPSFSVASSRGLTLLEQSALATSFAINSARQAAASFWGSVAEAFTVKAGRAVEVTRYSQVQLSTAIDSAKAIMMSLFSEVAETFALDVERALAFTWFSELQLTATVTHLTSGFGATLLFLFGVISGSFNITSLPSGFDVFDLAMNFAMIMICVPLILGLGIVFMRRRRGKLGAPDQA